MNIKTLLDETIDNIFLKCQNEFNIGSGDIDPIAQNKLDEITTQLAIVMEGVLREQRRANAIRHFKRNEDGYYYISPRTCRRYDLLEGVGLGSPRNATSDIIFIVDTETELYTVVGYMMGASVFEGNDEELQFIIDTVNEYEENL